MVNYSPNEVMDILLTLGECNRTTDMLPVTMLSYILIVAIQVSSK